MTTPQPTHKEWNERLDAILKTFDSASGYDESPEIRYNEAKQAINAAVLELVIGEDEPDISTGEPAYSVMEIELHNHAGIYDAELYRVIGRNQKREEERQTITGKPNPQ